MSEYLSLINEIVNNYPVLKTYSYDEVKNFSKEIENYLLNLPMEEDPPTLETYLDEYLKEVKEEYVKVTRTAIIGFCNFCQDSCIAFYKITKDDVTNYIKEEYERGLSQSSVRVATSRLRQFYAFLKLKKLITENAFDEVKAAEVEYTAGEQNLIPTEDEIKLIINELPVKKAAVVAITSVKGFALSEFWQICLSNETYTNLHTNEKIRTVICYTDNDMWENTELPYCFKETWSCDSFGYYRGLNDYVNLPDWFNECIIKLWDESKIDEETVFSECYFENNQIPLHSYENSIAKKIKELYDEGKLKAKYSLKNFRCFAVAREYNKNHDLAKIQKMLNHTTPNTTRRFLQNIGLK